MAEKKKAPKADYDRWDRTCIKVIKKPAQNGNKTTTKKK